MPAVLALLDGSVGWPARTGSGASPPVTSSSARWSRRCSPDELATEAAFPCCRPAAGTGVRRGEQAARRLRGLRGGRRWSSSTRTADRPGAGRRTCRVGPTPVVLDLTEACGEPAATDADFSGRRGLARQQVDPEPRHPRHGRLPAAPGRGPDRAGAAARPSARPRSGDGAGAGPKERHRGGRPVTGARNCRGPADRQRRRPHRVRAGPAAPVRLPAPRPAADRHPRRLRARRLRRLHRPGRRRPGPLLPAARRQRRRRARSPPSRGYRAGRRRCRRCSRRSPTATACSAASAPRASSPHHRRAGRQPDPTHDEAREIIGGNLCRCTGYQNIVKSVLRAAEMQRRAAVVTADVRRSRSSGSKTTGCSAATAPTSTTWATTRSRPRSCAARTPTPGSPTST